MASRARHGYDVRSQSKQVIFRVYTFFKKLSATENLSAEFFKKTQLVAAEACGVSRTTVQKILAESKKSAANGDGVSFRSPRKTYKRKKTVTDVDDFDADVVRRAVHEFYDKGAFTIRLLFVCLRIIILPLLFT